MELGRSWREAIDMRRPCRGVIGIRGPRRQNGRRGVGAVESRGLISLRYCMILPLNRGGRVRRSDGIWY